MESVRLSAMGGLPILQDQNLSVISAGPLRDILGRLAALQPKMVEIDARRGCLPEPDALLARCWIERNYPQIQVTVLGVGTVAT